MSEYERRPKVLEACRQDHHVIFVPDHVQGHERVALIEDYRRENGIPSGDRTIALDESDRGA